jgi:hypothetical protein
MTFFVVFSDGGFDEDDLVELIATCDNEDEARTALAKHAAKQYGKKAAVRYVTPQALYEEHAADCRAEDPEYNDSFADWLEETYYECAFDEDDEVDIVFDPSKIVQEVFVKGGKALGYRSYVILQS